MTKKTNAPRFSEVFKRLDALEAKPAALALTDARMMEQTTYRRVSRAARTILTTRIPAITAKSPCVTMYVHSWSVSYTTGGEDVSDFDTLVPGYVGCVASSGKGYTFNFNAATNKLQAYSAPGTEVVATTNLHDQVGTTPVLLYGIQPTIMDVYQARGDEVLQSVRCFVSQDVAATATNYWSIEARLRTAAEDFGRTLTSPALSNAKRSFVSLQDEVLYESSPKPGTRLSSGDRIVFYASPATQSCVALGDVTVSVDIQRKVT